MQTDSDVDLDGMLDDDLPCEVLHSKGLPCSVEVVARIIGCNRSALCCQTYVNQVVSWRDAGNAHVCGVCSRPVFDCWRIVPV